MAEEEKIFLEKTHFTTSRVCQHSTSAEATTPGRPTTTATSNTTIISKTTQTLLKQLIGKNRHLYNM